MTKNLVESVRYYMYNPVAFARDIIGVNPEKYQAEIMNSVRDNSMTTVRSGHGTGKTAVESWVILWYLLTRPYARIPCTAPTKHQLNDILWAELAKWIYSSPLKSIMEWTFERVYLRGMASTWFAAARTASNPNALQGFHGDNLLFIIDEASGVNDALFQPVLGALTEENAKLLMCGNPTELSGFFFESHNDKKTMYNCFRLDCNDSGRVSKDYIKTIIELYGTDSDAYRVRVAGEFPKALADSFISSEWAEKCSVKGMTHPAQASVIDVGIDVARYGDDETVLQTVYDRTIAPKPDKLKHNDTMQVTGAAVLLIGKLNRQFPGVNVRVKVDCDGLGVGVYDRLKEIRAQKPELNFELFECHFGGKGGKLKVGDPIGFANSTGLMWGTVRNALKAESIKIEYDAELISQLTNRKYKLDSNGDIVLERKEEMKKRGVHSPDRADALALALYERKKAVAYL
jgi:hypothetical protein